MTVLAIDIGGTNVKFLASGCTERRRFPSGPALTPQEMVQNVQQQTTDWDYEHISIGYPGPVVNDRILLEPKNLGPGWVDFDFSQAFGKPCKVVNDAAMQALGSYEGGQMLFLGLGTGLGSTLISQGTMVPMELAHLPYRKGKTFEDYVGQRGLDELGKKKWIKRVFDVVERLRLALIADYVVLGGGNAKKLKDLPEHCKLGSNEHAFVGGFRLWDSPKF